MDIIDHDRGSDPRRGVDLIIHETATPLERYDKELQIIIDESEYGTVIRCIDRCLWVYADRDTTPFAPVELEGNLACPEAIPLFHRQLEPETVRDLLMGKLMFSVFLFVDWYELSRIVADLGAELAWSSAKKGRTERAKPQLQRLATFGDRIPRIQLKDGNFLEGFSKIYRVLFEGIMPSSIAAQYVDVWQSEP